ncbi:MAG: ABC transporter permease [Armatimonadota bacterium]|nr:MAG: ABC transporter permease [Armatimonadota bacterium]
MSGQTTVPEAKTIERQIILPWGRSVEMTLKSIFVRLGRSIITASGIFLGTAFLVSVLTQTAILRGQAELDPSVSARNIWLVTMSLLVATVGIVNSMLMAVTERYKEIGTMKCLGALDRYIVRLFLLESGMLGALGALVGALVGFLVMGAIYAVRFGTSAFAKMGPAITLFGYGFPLWAGVVGAVLLGGILSVLAAMYPAWRAAKMPPAAALRVEI